MGQATASRSRQIKTGSNLYAMVLSNIFRTFHSNGQALLCNILKVFRYWWFVNNKDLPQLVHSTIPAILILTEVRLKIYRIGINQ